MRNVTYTLDNVVTAFLHIIQRFGADHQAAAPNGGGGCTYFVRQGNALIPVCIVGQYIADLGFLGALADDMGERPEYGACVFTGEGYSDESGGMWDRLAEHGLNFTDEAKVFMWHAQRSQDSNATWGQAVQEAIQEVEDYLVRSLPTHALKNKVASSILPMEEWERDLLLG